MRRWADGAAFPPGTVFYDGSGYWLADGFHRWHAHKVLDRAEIEADVRQGTQRDAILFSCSANAAHGMRRTNADKDGPLLDDAQRRRNSISPSMPFVELDQSGDSVYLR